MHLYRAAGRHARRRRAGSRTRTVVPTSRDGIGLRHPGESETARQLGFAGSLTLHPNPEGEASAGHLRQRPFRNPQQALRNQGFEGRQELRGRHLPGDQSRIPGIVELFLPTDPPVALRYDLRQPWRENALLIEWPPAAQRKTFGYQLAVADPVEHAQLRMRRKAGPQPHPPLSRTYV